MTPSVDPLAADATTQARLIRDGTISSAELVDACLGQIAALNPMVNAVVHHREERARTEAAQGGRPGPFAGVPLLLKDFGCYSAGDRYHAGSALLADRDVRPAHNCRLTERLLDGGFILLGRTNTPEFAMSSTTEPRLYGPTRNPWDQSRSAGGSSGGSAAAVATGMAPVAHANDIGGSIRIPAAACGVVGLKPSRRPDVANPPWSTWHGLMSSHVLTRSVRDAAALLGLLTDFGFDPTDAPPPGSGSVVRSRAGRSLRIGVLEAPLRNGTPEDPDVRDAVRVAGEQLTAAGHRLIPLDSIPAIADAGLDEPFEQLLAVECWREVARCIGAPAGDPAYDRLEPGTLAAVRTGWSLTARQERDASVRLQAYAAGVAVWWRQHCLDLLVTPVLPVSSPPIGAAVTDARDRLQYQRPFNVTGQPALSLPLHRGSGGLPIGVQLIARPGHDAVALEVAARLEEIGNWPPLAPLARRPVDSPLSPPTST